MLLQELFMPENEIAPGGVLSNHGCDLTEAPVLYGPPTYVAPVTSPGPKYRTCGSVTSDSHAAHAIKDMFTHGHLNCRK